MLVLEDLGLRPQPRLDFGGAPQVEAGERHDAGQEGEEEDADDDQPRRLEGLGPPQPRCTEGRRRNVLHTRF